MASTQTFPYSYSALYKMANDVSFYVQRDFSTLTNFGLNDEKLILFKEIIQKFNTLTSDNEFVRQKIKIDQQLENLLQDIKKSVKEIMTRVAIVFNEGTEIYNSFDYYNFRMSFEYQLIKQLKIIIKQTEKYFDWLRMYGVTNEHQVNLWRFSKKYEKLLKQKNQLESKREITAQERKNLAAELYQQLTKICKVAYTVWEKQNDGRKNDYFHFSETKNNQNKQENTITKRIIG